MPMTCIYTVIRSITVSTQRIIRTINSVPQLLFPISLVAHTCQYTSSIDEAKEILQSGSNRLEIYGRSLRAGSRTRRSKKYDVRRVASGNTRIGATTWFLLVSLEPTGPIRTPTHCRPGQCLRPRSSYIARLQVLHAPLPFRRLLLGVYLRVARSETIMS